MDFHLTDEQKDIRKAAKAFAEGELRDIARECDIREEFPISLLKKACELGFVGAFIDEAYGGAGLGFLEHAIIMEEFWRVDPGLGQELCSVTFGAEAIELFGSEQQKKRYLPPLTTGDSIMGFSITEPEAGSDTASATATAEKEGGTYVINGNKVMIGNGTLASFLLVYCLTNPEARSRSGRHSLVIVETEREGYEATRMEGKMGLRASDTANVFFNDVRVPAENLLGTEGKGFPQLMQFFDRSRAYVAAHGVGLAQGALDQAVQHVKGRQQFGQPLASFQITQFKIAEMATLIEAARTVVHKACWCIDHGLIDTKLVAMAKWFSCNVAVRVVDEALQLHGGYGYFNDHDIERFYRAAKVLEIYEGTKEIEKIIIARRILNGRGS